MIWRRSCARYRVSAAEFLKKNGWKLMGFKINSFAVFLSFISNLTWLASCYKSSNQIETLTFAIFQQDQAISTFNFLNNEDRYVGIVAIPPETTEMFEEERELIRRRQERRELLEFDESVSSREFGVDDLPPVTGDLNPDRRAHRLPLSDKDWTYNKWGPPRKWLRVMPCTKKIKIDDQ